MRVAPASRGVDGEGIYELDWALTD